MRGVFGGGWEWEGNVIFEGVVNRRGCDRKGVHFENGHLANANDSR